MKKYSKKDLENFERDYLGRIICPSGDYTKIKDFKECCIFDKECYFNHYTIFESGCIFGEHCYFGNSCCFGQGCSFGSKCVFGNHCIFYKGCSFDAWCIFGNNNYFQNNCTYKNNCNFGNYCNFGDDNIFDTECTFGDLCKYGKNCSHEGLTDSLYITLKGVGFWEDSIYFFKAKEGFFVRMYCFWGTLEEFKKKILEKYIGTSLEETYKMICDSAVRLLNLKEKWRYNNEGIHKRGFENI